MKKQPIFDPEHTFFTSGTNNTGKNTAILEVQFPRQYDVGIDNNNYTPVSYMELKEKIK